jgi:putative FmdB family regulatory protein
MLRTYNCPKCGEFEYLHGSIHDEILKVCPHCKDDRLKQQLMLNFKLTGPGFYSTDYKELS